VFTDEVLDRLRAAQALQQMHRAPSIKVALERVRDGLSESLAPRQPTFEEAVIARLELLAEVVKRLEAENTAIRAQLMLEATPLQQDERQELDDLRRRVTYLQGELERRDGNKQAFPQRPWWKFWGRSSNT
jgi:hypothetical protein